MLRLDTGRPARFCDGVTRRDFLHAGALAPLGLTLAGYEAARADGAAQDRDVNCIMLMLVGGPSQLDTWDLKPTHENGGPYKPVDTSVPGMRFVEPTNVFTNNVCGRS